MKDMRAFRIRNRDGQWAGAGIKWRSKGKVWLGTGPLKLALRNAFEHQAMAANGYARFNYNREQYIDGPKWSHETKERRAEVVRDYVCALAEREGWEVHMAEFGVGTISVITMKEFYEL